MTHFRIFLSTRIFANGEILLIGNRKQEIYFDYLISSVMTPRTTRIIIHLQ